MLFLAKKIKDLQFNQIYVIRIIFYKFMIITYDVSHAISTPTD